MADPHGGRDPTDQREWVVESSADLSADPTDRVWRCPACREGILLEAWLTDGEVGFIGRIWGCTRCAYWEPL